jgi:uncharacterized protein DUF4242
VVLYLAEFYLPHADAADLAHRAQAAAQLDEIRFVEAILVPGDESCFALFDAPSPDQVRSAGARAGITVDRVAEAISIRPRGRPPI